MDFKIDLTTHTPIYLQVMNRVKHAIATGELEPGDQLPTVRRLAADLRVNFNTIARAYRLLDEEGIISTQHGRGTYILEPSSRAETEKMRRKDLENLMEYLLEEAHKLGFSTAEVKALLEDKFGAAEQAE